MTTHVGWPPGLWAYWTGYHWTIATTDGWAPTAGEQGAPGDVWVFDEAAVEAHSAGGDLVHLLRFLSSFTLIDGSGSWTVPSDWYLLSGRPMSKQMVTLGGAVQGEIWMSSFSVDSSGTCQATADAVATATSNIATYFTSHCHSGTNLTSIKAVAYDPATGVATGDTGTHSLLIDGASGGASLPSEDACVLTLRTTHAKVHGRMYLPSCTVNELGSNGRFLTTFTDSTAASFKAFFDALHALSTPITPEVYSRTGRVNRLVLSVQVGDVVDVQRRRRNRLIENRSTRALA